jgi:Tol biopolymer transport system component
MTASGQPQVWTPLPAGYVIDYTWSPSGRWLAALWQERSDYSGKIVGQKLYLLNPTEARSDATPVSISLNGKVRWSPDGRWLLVSGVETNADGYRISLRLIPANGGSATVLDGKMGPPGANFVFISSLYWIP